jgi:hypothetical protein
MSKNTEKLVRVHIHQLPNEQHFVFLTENKDLYIKYGPETLGIDGFMAEYNALLTDEDTAIDVVRKSVETVRIANADGEFDFSYLGMSEFAKSNLKHYDPEVRKSAENLWVVFDHFGNITKQPYHQELGSSANLLQELRARATDYATTGLAPWADAHEQAAKNLAELLSVRNVEVSQQSALRMRDVRLRIDPVHQKIIDRMDAMINLKGKDFAGGFFAEYNTHATEYKNKLAQHQGRMKKTSNNEQVTSNN